MKKTIVLIMAAVALALSASKSNAQLSFSSVAGSLINFDNGTFYLTATSPTDQFTINTTSGPEAGYISGGPFTIGTVNNLGGGIQEASVSPTTATINLGGVVATLTWENIYSVSTVAGGFNYFQTINLSNFSGTSTSSQLNALAAAGSGIVELNYTWTSPESLSTLAATTTDITDSYSGQITASPVPEANTIVAGALMLLPLGIGAVRAIRKERTA
jgi:hypothetical protein